MSNTADPRSRDFDFLIGSWEVEHHRLDRRLVADTQWSTFSGTAVCRPVLGGAGNIDEIAMPSRGVIGMTLRLFNRSTAQWSLHWASSITGALEPPVVGGFENGVGRFFGDDFHDDRPVQVRFIWNEITGTSARWQQAFSEDQGRTWETNWVMSFTRMVRPSS